MNNKKNFIIIVLSVVAAGIVFFFWVSTNKKQTSNQENKMGSFVVASTERERLDRLEPSTSSSITDSSSSTDKDSAEALAQEDEQISESYTVVTDTVFVREAPKQASTSIGQIKKGEIIYIKGVVSGEGIAGNNQWGKMEYSNKDYYVWMGGLKKANNQEGSSQSNSQQVIQSISDIAIDDIIKGDFSSLKGVWNNGHGDKLVIDAQGHLDNGQYLSPVSQNSIREAGISYVNIITGNTGESMFIFNSGSTNPGGDNTDTSRPRLVITNNPSTVKFDDYYYRKEQSNSN